MPILDYLRYTELETEIESNVDTNRVTPSAASQGSESAYSALGFNGSREPLHCIRIPSFHTGSLGFIPGYQVYVHLVAWPGRRSPPDDCELYVSPFPTSDMSNLFGLGCLLEDKRGVVNRLVNAVSSFEINIVSAESCMINDGEHHYVELILDWTTAPKLTRPLPAPSGALWRYKYLIERIPVTDFRYIILYEKILDDCKDVIVFDRSYRRTLPAIDIRPFTRRRTERSTLETLLSGREKQKKGYDVILPLSRTHENHIRSFTGHEKGRLPYLLSSDGSTRTMRVFFPKKTRTQSIVNVAFEHLDIPGAVAAISQTLVAGGFSIIQSVLRKSYYARSIWEVTLEYLVAESDSPLAAFPYNINEKKSWGPAWVKQRDWFIEKMALMQEESKGGVDRYKVRVVPPSYPRFAVPGDPERLGVPLFSGRESGEIGSDGYRSEAPYLWIPRSRGVPLSVSPEEVKEHVGNASRRRKPIVFLSYPKRASPHADQVKMNELMKDRFNFDEYQEPDFTNIVNTVTDKIQSCDYFIGIWHHEEKMLGDQYTVSPWMPFEYGVAVSAGKETIILHSDRLPDAITRRINSGIAHPAYSDLAFKGAVDYMATVCVSRWGCAAPDSS